MVLAHEYINAVHLGSVGEDGVHACDITKDVTPTALHMCLTPRQIRKGLKDGIACLREPHREPRPGCGLILNACSNVLQHLQDGLLLTRTGLNLNEKRLTTFRSLFAQYLYPSV